jgi:hypothetical protein
MFNKAQMNICNLSIRFPLTIINKIIKEWVNIMSVSSNK